MSGFLPPLGFLAITGLAFSFLTINSIIWDESKAESPITAFVGNLKVFLTYFNCGMTRCCSGVLAGLVISAKGSSEEASLII